MVFMEKISFLVECINKSISYKTQKAVLFPHPEQVMDSAMSRFDRGERTEERLVRALENMTYEKRLKEYLLLSLTEIRLTGDNISLQLHERLLLKGRNNLFQLSYSKNNELILKQGQTLAELSNSKDSEAEEQT